MDTANARTLVLKKAHSCFRGSSLSWRPRKIGLEHMSTLSSLKGQLKKETFQEPSWEPPGEWPSTPAHWFAQGYSQLRRSSHSSGLGFSCCLLIPESFPPASTLERGLVKSCSLRNIPWDFEWEPALGQVLESCRLYLDTTSLASLLLLLFLIGGTNIVPLCTAFVWRILKIFIFIHSVTDLLTTIILLHSKLEKQNSW